MTPSKRLQSPLKGILRTPTKDSSSGVYQLRSPVSRTPRKSVTWSPQQRGMLVSDAAFKVSESPQTPLRLKAGSSPVGNSRNISREHLQTPEKQSQVAAVESEGVSSHRFSEEPTSRQPPEHSPSAEPRSSGPPHRMNTRSGRSPGRRRAEPLEAVSSPARSLTRKRRSDGSVGSRSGSRVPSAEVLVEHSPPSEGSGSSQLNSTSTEDDSLDIVEAAVTKTQFTGGLKMNISFSRKSSESLVSSGAPPKPPAPSGSTPSRSYGFRQTPDRRQREAAARLGYGNQPPRFSTPRPPKGPGAADLLNYQVEMETQTSGVPKLKLKRADSTTQADSGAPPAAAPRPSQSPKAPFSKQREPGCVSPSGCAHATPGKGLQTFICQSYTPTRHLGGTAPPVAAAESVPLTPSPPGVGKTPPDHLKSWPRRKRAQPAAAGGKESAEEAELGVRRLQDVEDLHPPSARAPLEDFYWMDQLGLQAGPPPEDPARAGQNGVCVWVEPPLLLVTVL